MSITSSINQDVLLYQNTLGQAPTEVRLHRGCYYSLQITEDACPWLNMGWSRATCCTSKVKQGWWSMVGEVSFFILAYRDTVFRSSQAG
ncbi:MAG: hypothetical protein EVA61_03960 [Litorivicinaceae bacterium]|nr:MAG: hypothetical protein EVA61_03960 [Litorivicinaceae bacterium]